MATTANLHGGKFPDSGEEDIAAIAKQISDHAEAIYQTWKSRGLAPTEILNCHSNAQAADKFGSALTPKPQTPKSSPPPSPAQTVVELLSQPQNLDNNNLEKLVNNFVVEDKARLAAQRQKSPAKTLPSSIQFALQKFEKNNPPILKPATPANKPTYLRNTPSTSSLSSLPTQQKMSSIQQQKPQLSPKPVLHQQEILLETIETTFPPDLQKPETPKRNMHFVPQQKEPPSTITAGLQTWPLKNKLIQNEPKKSMTQSKISEPIRTPSKEESLSKYSTLPSKNSSAYLDEVAREEERLINALKTGVIIAEDHSSPERTLRTKTTKIAAKKENISPVSTPSLEYLSQTTSRQSEKPYLSQLHQVEKTFSPALADKSFSLPITENEFISPLIEKQFTPTSIEKPFNTLHQHEKPLSKDDRDGLSNMSLIDYAKVRYRAAQQNPLTQQRLDDNKLIERSASTGPNNTINSSEPVIVSKVRNKFEPSTEIVTKTSDGESGSSVSGSSSRWGLRPRGNQQVPHPELTCTQRQHIRAAADKGANSGFSISGNNPVRPFLTRGSVAERVLIFEKCPSELMLDKRRGGGPVINTWRNGHDVHSKAQTYSRTEKVTPKPLPPHTTLQRHIKANRHVFIPKFYFPHGKPAPSQQLESVVQRVTSIFAAATGGIIAREDCANLARAADVPIYWKVPLFLAAATPNATTIDLTRFTDFWKEMTATCHDAASRFIYILTRGHRQCLSPEDFIPLVQDVVDTHPGLTFLKEATEFHSRYVHTVIARIFYCVNRSWSGKISLSELRRSNLLSVIQLLEEEEDINQVTQYFSYEHFYVIYCKFWELDRDHDLFIDRQDLTRHNDHALSSRIIDRIFSGAVGRGGQNGALQRDEKMSYTEFVWFLLSEEDKMHPTAIEYWFRCMDLDGDGFLSMYELEYFYEEQMQRMEAIGIETLPFEDCLCQMLDMVKPKCPGKIALGDLKRCKMTPIFFDTFFNLEKYLDHEQRDPFASQRDHDGEGHELSDWDRFAAEEYELLVAEEGGEQQDNTSFDETDCEDILSTNLDLIMPPETDLPEVTTNSVQNGHHSLLTNGWHNVVAGNNCYDDHSDDDYAQDSDECSI